MQNDWSNFVNIIRRTLTRVLKSRMFYALLILGGATTLILGNRSWSVESNLGECSYEAIRLTPDRHGQEGWDTDREIRRIELIKSCMISKGFIFNDNEVQREKKEDPVPPLAPLSSSASDIEEARYVQDVMEESIFIADAKYWKRDWTGHWL